MSKLKIFLADLTYYNRFMTTSQTVPLSVGYIAAYTKKQFGDDVEISIFKDPEELISMALLQRPDIIGLSAYCWNYNLNGAVMDSLQPRLGKSTLFVLGGPSVDTVIEQQKKLFVRFPHISAAVPNEGEIGFANLVRAVLAGDILTSASLPGVILRNGENLTVGDLSVWPDPAEIPSPYLEGFLDRYLNSSHSPMIQTLRSCPYTCKFCVSGRSRAKIRSFPKSQVKEELTFLAQRYKDFSHIALSIVDDNFGLFPQDIEIAEHIRHLSETVGYPKSVYFFNDKRFTDTSRAILEVLGDINSIGLNISLQTETPEALQAINRRNLSEEEISGAINWAAERNLDTTTELIFGLPGENKISFVAQLEKAVMRGFDSVLCHNLFLLEGSELNRTDHRQKFEIKTKWRLPGPNYGKVGDVFVAEHEEVVTSSSTFSFDDYIVIREINFMFYCIFGMRWYRPFFNGLRHIGVNLTEFCVSFFHPDMSIEWPHGYIKFLEETKASFHNELHETADDLNSSVKKMYHDNGNQVGAPTRLNLLFGARIIYMEQEWVGSVLRSHLFLCGLSQNDAASCRMADELLELCGRERIPLMNPNHTPECLSMNYDVISWASGKFSKPLQDYRTDQPLSIVLKANETTKKQIEDYNNVSLGEIDLGYFYNAINAIYPRSRLLYDLEYEKKDYPTPSPCQSDEN